MSKVAKANSNSSNRQKAAFMKSLVDIQKASKCSHRNQRERSRRKALKQANTLDLIHPDPGKAITHEVINSFIVFIDGGDCNNPRMHPQLPVLKGKNKQEPKPMRILSLSDDDLSSPKVHLNHPECGLILPGSPTQILLVPRADSLKHMGMHKPENNASLANALDAVSQATLSSSIRGHDRIVIRGVAASILVWETRSAEIALASNPFIMP